MDAPGGTGKTLIFDTLYNISKVSEIQEKVVCVALTGIAATLLPKGQTVHSAFKVPIPTLESSTCGLRSQGSGRVRMRNCKLLVWDKAPMSHRYVLKCVNWLFQDIMQNQDLFGGKVLLLGGDFLQTLPVVQGATLTSSLTCILPQLSLWSRCFIRKLY
jgi:ATP-dependent DNA helicase PIF1